MQWFADAKARKPKTYQHGSRHGLYAVRSDTTKQHQPLRHDELRDPYRSPLDDPVAIRGGLYGLPTTLRDKGAWMMFADTPYAYLHICGSPWEGQ